MTETRDIALKVVRKDAARHVVFGWAYVAKDAEGLQVVDHSGQAVELVDLEKAMHEFMRDSRASGEMHDGEDSTNVVVECVVFTPEKLEAMGIEKGAVPLGAWIGVEVSEDTFAKVKGGSLLAFSIEGVAREVAA